MTRKTKKTNIPWIGEIPSDWSTCRFKNVASFKKDIAKNKSYLYERLALTLNGVIKRSKDDDEGLQPDTFDSYQILNPGDFVFKMIDLQNISTSRVGKSPFLGLVSPAYLRFEPSPFIDSDFYYYYLMNLYYQCVFNKIAGDGVRSALNKDDIGNIECPVPPFEEQNKIVKEIKSKEEKINALIANEEKQIEKLKEYKQALISEAVTKGLDPNVPMKDSGVEWIDKIPADWNICRLKSSFSFGKGLPITKANLLKSGIKVISYGQIHAKNNFSYTINEDLFRYVSDEYLVTNPNSLVTHNDFIFADTSEDEHGSGDFVLIDEDDSIFAGYHTIILKHINERFNFSYIAFLFMSDYWKRQIRSKIQGVKVYSISSKILSQATILVPSFEQQNEISLFLIEKCQKIDLLCYKKQQKIERYTRLRRSIIYEYVTGKMEVCL